MIFFFKDSMNLEEIRYAGGIIPLAVMLNDPSTVEAAAELLDNLLRDSETQKIMKSAKCLQTSINMFQSVGISASAQCHLVEIIGKLLYNSHGVSRKAQASVVELFKGLDDRLMDLDCEVQLRIVSMLKTLFDSNHWNFSKSQMELLDNPFRDTICAFVLNCQLSEHDLVRDQSFSLYTTFFQSNVHIEQFLNLLLTQAISKYSLLLLQRMLNHGKI